MKRLIPLVLAGLAAACSPQPAAEAAPAKATADQGPQRHRESGLAVIPLSVASANVSGAPVGRICRAIAAGSPVSTGG